MATAPPINLSQYFQEAAWQAGLAITSMEPGADFNGAPTLRLKLSSAAGAAYSVEVSEALGPELEKNPELLPASKLYLETLEKRMQAPRPNVLLTLHGLPISMQGFQWPYHRSTSGADSFILHGIAQLADRDSALHAKISASLTVTFAEVLPALEQPYAEGVTFNAIRKTLDLGQIELLKSGNRQPVPVSTRYYSFRQRRFIFSETTETQRKDFLRTKIFWISARLGGLQPAWIADPYDAQYLDTSAEELRNLARELATEDLVLLDFSGEYATATEKLVAQANEFVTKMEASLALLKPKFNEAMRAGHTNM